MRIFILACALLLAGTADAAQMKYWRLNSNPVLLQCDSVTRTYNFRNPESAAIYIKKIERRVVGADGVQGEYGWWMSGSSGGLRWDGGDTVYVDPPNMPVHLDDFTPDYLLLPAGASLTLQVFCGPGRGMMINHLWAPEIGIWYTLTP